ncbi:sigma-70 family RNA polymerase sigma factor [Acidimicrobiaceae bacterium AH-315-P05]|nr:sigma-70 family RNA polymerase sigma factor [Acidimicrobiaceae bacterium AH-315-P05]
MSAPDDVHASKSRGKRKTRAERDNSQTNNDSLLAACRQGDQEAWAELVNRYERLVFSVSLRVGLNREDASDVAQLTFAALIENLDSVRKSESVGWWLATVARRTARRMMTQQSREIASPTELVDQIAEPTDDQLAQSLLLHDGLARLDETCRELLTALFAADEASYVAVARRLGRPVGSIGPMRARCLEHLRELLDPAENVDIGEARKRPTT